MMTSYYFSNRIREPGMNLVAVSNSYPTTTLMVERHKDI